MPFDNSSDPAADPLVSRPRRGPPALVLAGVAGACLLGAGLGLWARPSDIERELRPRHAAAAPPQPSAPRQIEIRVDHAPAPVAQAAATPAPVTPPIAPAAESAVPTPAGPEPLAPRPAANGLVRVHAVAPPRLAAGPLASAASRERRAEARKVEAERAARKARLDKARLEKARIAEVAEAKARARAERRVAEIKAAERRADQAAAERRQARLAEEKARVRAARQFAPAPHKPPVRAPAKLLAKGAAPTKAARAATRCASPDPGAALACADPALNAAERQLARAYRQAQDAGVPPERLERQQQRWLAARANTARQAPWAVHDIYLARIAELQDQTREATARGD